MYRLTPLLPLLLAACAAQVAAPPGAPVPSALPTASAAPSATATNAPTATPTATPTPAPTPTGTPTALPTSRGPLVPTPTPLEEPGQPLYSGLGGTVREADGRAATGARVRVRRLGSGSPRLSSDDSSFEVLDGAWWADGLPAGERYEVAVSRSDWQETRQAVAGQASVDVVAPVEPGASATDPATWPALAVGRKPTAGNFELKPRSPAQAVHVPTMIPRGKVIQARVMLSFSDSCHRPYLPGCVAIVDAAARTVRFEAPTAYEREGTCFTAGWNSAIFVPFSLPDPGFWKVLVDPTVPTGYEVRVSQ